MKDRNPVGYVVEVDGVSVTLNLLDQHKGHIAGHSQGISNVTDIGSLLGIASGSRLLVMRVQSIRFAEPKELHRRGRGESGEPLRHLSGPVVGQMAYKDGNPQFTFDSLSTPPLGGEAFPLTGAEHLAMLGNQPNQTGRHAVLNLGSNVRGEGSLKVSINDLLSRHVAVLGSSGQGKSCYTAAILQQLTKLSGCRAVIFDINGEYQQALAPLGDRLKVTTLGGPGATPFKIPYYALGRFGLHRLLIPSERTQRPALSFAVDQLHRVKYFQGNEGGAGLHDDTRAFLFDDCRSGGEREAHERMERLRSSRANAVNQWPPMAALAALVAESHSLVPGRNGPERSAFSYSNVSPLITRIWRFAEDQMFTSVVDTGGSDPRTDPLDWRSESRRLVDEVFGEATVPWRAHIIDLRHVAHDLMPFVLGSLLELYAYELFRRGQENKIPTLLVLEEAHHYLRPTGSGEEGQLNSLAYERLAKEGRKFGLSLWLSTQRPSEVSPTVLAQCNTWITFRLTSDTDLNAVGSAAEWSDRRDVRRIAGLPRQHALVFGGGVTMPTLIKSPLASPLTRSEDAAFDRWAEEPIAPPNAPTDTPAAF